MHTNSFLCHGVPGGKLEFVQQLAKAQPLVHIIGSEALHGWMREHIRVGESLDEVVLIDKLAQDCPTLSKHTLAALDKLVVPKSKREHVSGAVGQCGPMRGDI